MNCRNWMYAGLVAALFAPAASAQTRLEYRGTLRNGGLPVTTATTLRFVVCRGGNATGAGECAGLGAPAVAFTQIVSITPAADGTFSYNIGPVPEAVFDTTQPMFLQAEVNGTLVLPRKAISVGQDTASAGSVQLESVASSNAKGLVLSLIHI